MSRIGKNPIIVPQGVEVNIDNQTVTVKGPKGTLTREFLPAVNIAREEDKIVVSVASEKDGNLHGLTRTLINNMVIGVTQGFEKALEMV